MTSKELDDAVRALIDREARTRLKRVKPEVLEAWCEQILGLLTDVLPQAAEAWGLLPRMSRDAPPPDVEGFSGVLAFLGPDALYRLIAWVSGEKLVLRLERTPFSTPMRVSVADNRHFDQVSRSWQFLCEEQRFNLHVSENPSSTAFVHEMARRFGWPLPLAADDG